MAASTTPRQLTEAQHAQIQELRERFDREELSDRNLVWLDESCIRRYLAARDWKTSPAEKMIRETLKWRDEFRPWEVKVEEVKSQIRHGHMYNTINDFKGHPAVCLRVHTQHDPHTDEQRLRFMIWSMDKAIFDVISANNGLEKMVWLVSCKGYTMKHNGSLSFAKRLNYIVCNHYPERLEKVFIFHAPLLFRTFWKLIAPFIDPITRAKFIFVSDDHSKRTFSSEFDINNVEEDYLGNSKASYDAEAYINASLEAETRCERVYENDLARARKERENRLAKAQPCVTVIEP